jgi:hypothetical protein
VLALVAVTLASAYTAPPAYANGRFPKAQAITTPPGDDATIFLRATFGVIVSHDAGKTWAWMCEQALGFSSTWDPPLAATKDGRLWVALTNGLRSTVDGCAIADTPSIQGELVADLTTDATGDHVFAVSSAPGKPAFVWRSDGVATGKGPAAFTRFGKGLSGFRFDTIEVAPSNPSRVYLTATPDGLTATPDGGRKRAHIFRSDDGGATIRELPPTLPNDGRLFVAAVDPRDPDRVLVRQLSETGSDVLLSTDGGKTFVVALHMKAAMFGFTRAPDGSAYYAGSGDPTEGIWHSFDRGATWQPGAKTGVFCLHATASRLLVCSNPYMPGGYAIAESLDRGMTVKPLATFDDVRGPVACDAGSPCDAPWPGTRALIATSAHTWETSYRAGIDGGVALDAEFASSMSAPVTAPSSARRDNACGCAVAGAPARPRDALFASFAFTLAALALAGRRSHRGSREAQRRAKPDHRPIENLPVPGTGGVKTIRRRPLKS